MSKVTVGLIQPGEWSLLRDIRLEALQNEPESFVQGYDEVAGAPDKVWQDQAQESANGGPTLIAVARVADKFVSMGLLYLPSEEKYSPLSILRQFYVSPEYRRQGIATKILNFLIDQAMQRPGVVKVRATVGAELAAVKFYEKAGFEQEGFMKKEMLVDGRYIDERVMSKFLR